MAPPFSIWLTGLPAVGKTTVAQCLASMLPGRTCILDSDEVRAALWPHLKHTVEDRRLNVLSLARLARIIREMQQNVIVACVSPDETVRRTAVLIAEAALVHLYAEELTLVRRAQARLERRGNQSQATIQGVQLIQTVRRYYDCPTSNGCIHLSTEGATPLQVAKQIIEAMHQ